MSDTQTSVKPKKFNLKQARLTLAIVLGVLVCFSIGYIVGISGFVAKSGNLPNVTISREVPVEKNLDFSLFWKVWDTLGAKYVDQNKIVPSKMVYGAIKGMVASLGDPYTAFLTPAENKLTEEDLQGNFDGVGIQIGYRSTQLAVVAPLPNTPADKAGVKAGDYIIQIKDENKNIDQSTSEMTLPQAVQIIRGTKGTKVTLTLIRDEETEPIIVDLIRDNIDVPSVTLEFVGEEGKIAHIKILKFGAETKQEWNKAVTQTIASPGVNKIIVDLRNNPGGYLQAAVDIASDFVKLGDIVVSEQEGNGHKENFVTKVAPRLMNYEVIVLVNKGSASASEILSGALRDQRNIRLVGENTFGKGTVQEPMQLESGSGLHITIAKWLTPSGAWIHEKGLTPDIDIKDDSTTPEDEQLQAAVEAIQ